jgi:ATP-binding cassette subfamily B (MDR/TAP) protein 1
LDAFQVTDTAEMVDRGEFYALMFFVLALVILAVYATLGWVTNIISTVSPLPSHLKGTTNIS